MSLPITTFYPWQEERASEWLSQRERFAHAWLLHGVPGIGKTQFARAAAASLLCTQPVQSRACGHCDACLWCQHGNHPDLRVIRPESVAQEEDGTASESKQAPSKEIRVEQLRQLHTWFNTATHRGGYRVAVLYPAESLNQISANALLKVLEEPPASTIFLLVADAPDRLLPTIVSRCRRLVLPRPDTAVALDWLKGQVDGDAQDWLSAAGGGPVAALALSQQQRTPYPEWLGTLWKALAARNAEDAMVVMDELEKLGAAQWIPILQRSGLDMQLVQHGQPVCYYPGLQGVYEQLVPRAQPVMLAQLLKWLNEQSRWAQHPLNAKLFVQHLLDRLMQCFS
ncbi:DNA polymerase III subunit delta' [Paenalcaligenes sp. Me131]|uniref:DNA polymerase III subunit delta' n=1 Tax=Paenalcaligenes sp. Me131 TaxID=3392636 RepID=UPI003D2D5E69